MKSEEGNESVDAIMAQAIGKQPLLSFSAAGDSSAQFIQLLQALEQQEHNQGWPLLSSLKVQVQKCEKCSREYCSSINYRRHLRVHHRLKSLIKDSAKSRDWLGTFWDKLSLEDSREVVSFKHVALGEVPGSSIIKELSALVQKSGFSSLPQLYLKAGSEILDIIQGKPSRFPISSSELFTILDYASEKTFLCGSAVSIQKYVFDGNAGKTGLETKNVVAFTSFLLEQKLINAWRADKDAEALRFQKLLVEEEEAARKRRAEDLEKKRQKRLKQKEQKEKTVVNETIDNALEERAVVKTTDVNENIGNALEEKVDANEIDNASEEMRSAETSIPVACDTRMDAVDVPSVDQHLSTVEHSKPVINVGLDFQTAFDGGRIDSGNSSPVDESQFVQGGGRRWRKVAKKSRMAASPGSHATQSSQASKPTITPTSSYAAQGSPASKLAVTPTSSHAAQGFRASRLAVVKNRGNCKDPRSASVSHKVWSPKAKPEFDQYGSKARVQEAPNEPAQAKEHLVGPSTFDRDCSEARVEIQKEAPNESAQTNEHEIVPSQKFDRESLQARARQETPNEPDLIKKHNVMIGSIPVPLDDFINNNSEACDAQMAEHQTPEIRPSPVPSSTSRQTVEIWRDILVPNGSSEFEGGDGKTESSMSGGIEIMPGNLLEDRDWESAICITEAFHHQRWKEAVEREHITVVSVLDSDVTVCEEKQQANVVDTLGSSSSGAAKSKFSTKPEKGMKKKYIPEQRHPT